MTAPLCPNCLRRESVDSRGVKRVSSERVQLVYVQFQSNDPAKWKCPKCQYALMLDYGETKGGQKIVAAPMPKLDHSVEKKMGKKVQKDSIREYIRSKFAL